MWSFGLPRFMERCAQISPEGLWPMREDSSMLGFVRVGGKVMILLSMRD